MLPQVPDSEPCRFLKKRQFCKNLVFTNVNVGGMVVPPMYGVWGDSLRCPPLRHPLAYGVEKAPIVRYMKFTPFFSCLENGLVISNEISKG